MVKWVLVLDGAYEVSTEGQIRNVRTKHVCKPYNGRYIYGGKRRKTILLSRVVCEAFHGPPPRPGLHAAHWDGNPRNQRPDNLRWATPKENEEDKRRHGTWDNRSLSAKLKRSDVVAIRKKAAAATKTPKGQMPKGFCKPLAKRYGCTVSNISCIVHGVSWQGVS